MSTAYLDPEPFRKWYARQKERFTPEEIACWFGVDSRTLRHWDEESSRIRRGEFEDAVMRSQFSMWDIYPELEDEDDPGELGEVGRRSPHSYLSDAQLHLLHRIHLERRVSVHRLGGEIWEQVGFCSPVAARNAIRVGFRRLGLPPIRFDAKESLPRRCKALTHRGYECLAAPLWGSDYCRAHDPATRQEVRFHALSISPFVKEAA